MANKNSVDGSVTYKTLEEMTDGEFLAEIDSCCEPLYFDYLYAPKDESCPINGYISATHLGVLAKGARAAVRDTNELVYEPQTVGMQKKSVSDGYRKKRSVLLIVIAVLALAMTVIVALGAAGIGDALGVYKTEEKNIAIIDPIVSMINYVMKNDSATDFLVYFTDTKNAYELIPVFAAACAIALYAVCMVLMLIKALIALFDKRSEKGYFIKRKFGFLSVVALLCTVIAALGGLYAGGGSIIGIVDFLGGAGHFCAGVGLYVMAAAPIVTLVMSCLAYSKQI